jgi:hypothetical protein
MNNKELIKIDSTEGVSKIFNNILNLVEEIPFGNSDFQNRLVIVNNELSPHRAYRHSALRIIDRLQALNECYYNLKKISIEIKKLERKLENEQDELERELIQIEIDQKKSSLPYTQKLIKDAIQEIESLYPIIEKIGKMSREEFEACEKKHFETKLLNTTKGKNEVITMLESISSNKDLYDSILEKGKEILLNYKENLNIEHQVFKEVK